MKTTAKEAFPKEVELYAITTECNENLTCAGYNIKYLHPELIYPYSLLYC